MLIIFVNFKNYGHSVLIVYKTANFLIFLTTGKFIPIRLWVLNVYFGKQSNSLKPLIIGTDKA